VAADWVGEVEVRLKVAPPEGDDIAFDSAPRQGDARRRARGPRLQKAQRRAAAAGANAMETRQRHTQGEMKVGCEGRGKVEQLD